MTFLADRVTNVPVSFRQLRMKDAEGALQEGVVGANDLKIVQRAAGANMSVDFSVGAGYINIDSGTRSGLVHFYNDAVANVSVTASNATNPRVDFAIVRYNDTSIPAGTGGNTPTPEILAGTPTATAQATNPTAAGYLLGAPTLPNDAILLGAFTVPATSTSVVTANILDRRKWARGAYRRIERFANAAAGSNYTTTSTTLTGVDTTNLNPRIECSGTMVRVALRGRASLSAAGLVLAGFAVDGVIYPTASNDGLYTFTTTASQEMPFNFMYEFVPAAGSHVIAPLWRVTAGTATLFANANVPSTWTVEEILRPNVDNT